MPAAAAITDTIAETVQQFANAEGTGPSAAAGAGACQQHNPHRRGVAAGEGDVFGAHGSGDFFFPRWTTLAGKMDT